MPPRQLDFSPVILISDFWHSELCENTFVLFKATQFVATGYSILKKLVQAMRKISRQVRDPGQDREGQETGYKSQARPEGGP